MGEDWNYLETTPGKQTTETLSVGLSTQTPDEERRLRDFLDQELAKFEEVIGQTDKLQHRIRLKTDQPIKQRYRPRSSPRSYIQVGEHRWWGYSSYFDHL